MQVRSALLALAAVLCLAFNAAAQDKPQDKLMTAHSFTRPVTVGAEYLLYLPKGYDAAADKRWPLILFLHGAGESGTNVWRVDFHGPSRFLLLHPEFPFILVSPLCPPERGWSNETLLALLDEVTASHKVDTNRVYLTGLSMGGYGTWSLATSHPERFAAVVPICGGGSMIDIILGDRGYMPTRKANFKGLPVWAFHGGKDNVVPPQESERMIEAMKKLGAGDVKLTIYPDATHNSWEQTYTNAAVYDWMLSHTARAK
jgi:predicted peptidase